jgi:hypothetical protein
VPYPMFDVSRLRLRPLAEREHQLSWTHVLPLDAPDDGFADPQLERVAESIVQARRQGAPVILMMGAHVIKTGLSRFVIDFMERQIVTHVATNGAGSIHDLELALVGGTSESVSHYIREGQFGLWAETGRINDALVAGLPEGMGYGESVGRMIATEGFPHQDLSILAAGYRLRVPVTIHAGIGYDIIHEHPNCNGAALGEASYRDFRIIAQAITKLEGGVLLNFGTAVMGPEVYLKALSMARNLAAQDGATINHFTTAVFDLQNLGPDLNHEASKDDPRYYYRPFKTILVRTVQDGGESFYIRGDHTATLPNLRRLVLAQMPG